MSDDSEGMDEEVGVRLFSLTQDAAMVIARLWNVADCQLQREEES